MFDLVLRAARLSGHVDPVDIGVINGRIAAIEPRIEAECASRELGGKFVCSGFCETHVHLDKSNLLDRCPCETSLQAAVRSVSVAKRDFTEQDVYIRAQRTLERCILHGTTQMRTHVEVDPRVGLTSVRALQQLKRDYAWAIDLQLCCFPQEGLLDDPGCDEVLVAALEAGCDLVGGAPYFDRDRHRQIDRVFDLARRFDVDIDLHLDFDLDAGPLDADYVCRMTDRCGWGGRVAIGHATKLSTLDADRFDAAAARLCGAGVGVTVLPATDLFMMGRGQESNVPRGVAPAHRLVALGVTCSISTNNVLNPFTPYGDCSLLRIANLFANIVQLGDRDDLETCFEMITSKASRLMRLDAAGVRVGGPANLVVLDCASSSQAVAEIAPAMMGFRAGRPSFERPAARLFRP